MSSRRRTAPCCVSTTVSTAVTPRFTG
jgi:hypothetical protein